MIQVFPTSPHCFFSPTYCSGPRTRAATVGKDDFKAGSHKYLFKPSCQNPLRPDGVDCVFTSSDKIGINSGNSPGRGSLLVLYLHNLILYERQWTEGEAFASRVLLRAIWTSSVTKLTSFSKMEKFGYK